MGMDTSVDLNPKECARCHADITLEWRRIIEGVYLCDRCSTDWSNALGVAFPRFCAGAAIVAQPVPVCSGCHGTGRVHVTFGPWVEDYDMGEAMDHKEGDPPLQKKIYADWESRPCPRCTKVAALSVPAEPPKEEKGT